MLPILPRARPFHHAVLLLLLIATTLATLACDLVTAPDELNPTPDFDSAINASVIWEEYQSSATGPYANDQYKGRWAIIVLDGVRRNDEGNPAGIDVVAGTRAIIRTPGSINEMVFRFRFPEDTENLERGMNSARVLCNITGTDITGSRINFDHCRPSS